MVLPTVVGLVIIASVFWIHDFLFVQYVNDSIFNTIMGFVLILGVAAIILFAAHIIGLIGLDIVKGMFT